MSITPEAIRTHIDYTAWASKYLVDEAAKLSPEELNRDFGTADRSVLGTLVHVFAADRIWLARVAGLPPSAFVTDADRDIAVLQNDWPAIYDRWCDWASKVTDGDAASLITYKDMQGNPQTRPLWQIVLHVVNHGTHHRGQVSGFLRTMGYRPPQIDLIYYFRDLKA